ncbi:MAG: hypothetical protein ACYCXY_07620 [Acidimicrobiales bacterium]
MAAIRFVIVFRRNANRPALVSPQMCVKTEERERLGPAEVVSPAVLDGEPPELDQAGLLGVQLQVELGQALHQVLVELLGVGTILEADDGVVSERRRRLPTSRRGPA